jgi:hypothetical protein
VERDAAFAPVARAREYFYFIDKHSK